MKPRLPYHLLSLLVTLCAGSSAWAESPGLGEWMAIGDSITHGTDSSSYRWFLQKILIDNGFSYSTVGYHSGCYRPTDTSSLVYGGTRFDDNNNHSAQFNIWTDEIAGTAYRRATSVTGLDSTNIRNWLGISTEKTPDAAGNIGTYTGPVFSPDTYTIMLGTNDLNNLSSSTSVSTMLANMDIIADSISENAQANGKEAVAYIMSVTATNYSAGLAANVHAYNEQLRTWTEGNSRDGVQMVYVDVNRGLADVTRADGYGVASMYASDKLHPTDQASLLIAGNLAQGMGYAGRTAGQQRRDAAEFSVVQYANGFAENTPQGVNISLTEEGALDFSAPGDSSLSFGWGDASPDNGYTVDFSLTLGNGATDGWNTTDFFSVSLGDGSQSGTLLISEAYIQWGSTILFSRDMSTLSTNAEGQTENLRISYILGDPTNGLDSGYYVWLGDMLIGEALSGSTSTSSGVTLSYGGDSQALLYNFAMDNASWAPTTTLQTNEAEAWLPTPAYTGSHGPAQGNTVDWSAANQGAKDTSLISGNRKSSSYYFGNWSGDSEKLGDCTTWDFSDTNTSGSYMAAYGQGDRTVEGEGVCVRISGDCPGFLGAYGVYGNGAQYMGTLTGNVTLQLDAQNATYGFLAGAGNHSIDGTLHLILNAGTVTGDVTGGFTVAQTGQSIGNVELYLNGGTINGSVYGGNSGANAAAGVITGNVSITMTGGILKGNLNGGGNSGAIGGNTSITITGGTIYGNVNGGAAEGGSVSGSDSVTIESNRAYIRGSITGSTVTLKDVENSGNPGRFDAYSGAISTGNLILDGFTVSQFNAVIHTDSLTLRNGSHTHLSQVESVRSILLEEGSSLSLTQLRVGDGQSCAIQQMSGGNGQVTITGLLQLGAASALTGDITLGTSAGGYVLDVNSASIEGKLLLNIGGALSQNTLTALSVLTEGDSYTLFEHVGELVLPFALLSLSDEDALSSEDLGDASLWFTNLQKGRYALVYSDKKLSLRLIPEPTTAALSLLALAGLAARRRRK